jgi:hypothetical protein
MAMPIYLSLTAVLRCRDTERAVGSHSGKRKMRTIADLAARRGPAGKMGKWENHVAQFLRGISLHARKIRLLYIL